MIPPFTRARVRGWLPEPLHNFLYNQPVLYRMQPGFDISFSPTSTQEEYPFGAVFTSTYYGGPAVAPRGWTSVPKITLTVTWKPFGAGDDEARVGPVDYYFHVDPVAWAGPPPYPVSYDGNGLPARTPQMYVSWYPIVDGDVVSVNSGPGFTIRSNVISNAHPQATVENPTPAGIYQAHTHDLVLALTDLSTNVQFDFGVEFFAPGNPVSTQVGDYLDHLEFLVGASTLLIWYPQGHPAEPALTAPPTDVHEHVVLLDWEVGIDNS